MPKSTKKNLILGALTLNLDKTRQEIGKAATVSIDPRVLPWDGLIGNFGKATERIAEGHPDLLGRLAAHQRARVARRAEQRRAGKASVKATRVANQVDGSLEQLIADAQQKAKQSPALGSIVLDTYYSAAKSIREIQPYKGITAIQKGADIVRGGFKLGAGVLGAGAGLCAATLDVMKLNKEQDVTLKFIYAARANTHQWSHDGGQAGGSRASARVGRTLELDRSGFHVGGNWLLAAQGR